MISTLAGWHFTWTSVTEKTRDIWFGSLFSTHIEMVTPNVIFKVFVFTTSLVLSIHIHICIYFYILFSFLTPCFLLFLITHITCFSAEPLHVFFVSTAVPCFLPLSTILSLTITRVSTLSWKCKYPLWMDLDMANRIFCFYSHYFRSRFWNFKKHL